MDSWIVSLFNMIFTAVPIVLVALWDRYNALSIVGRYFASDNTSFGTKEMFLRRRWCVIQHCTLVLSPTWTSILGWASLEFGKKQTIEHLLSSAFSLVLKTFFSWNLSAVLHSLIIFFFVVFCSEVFDDGQPFGTSPCPFHCATLISVPKP